MDIPEQDRERLTAGAAMWSTAAVPDAAIPAITMADGPMGIASGLVDERDVSVLTPSGVALGATWDPALVARVGALVGGEAKRAGIDMVLAPNLNLPRSPLAGRAFEMFSEDPLLTGTLGAAWITGLQSRNVGAVAKHVVCNDSETARDRYDVTISDAALRDTYLLPFEMAARAGCAGMLMAYNAVNGSPCVEQGHVITTIIKGEWQFPGVVMSDWFAVKNAGRSLAAGLDLEMPGPPRTPADRLAGVPADRVADAAGRVAAAAIRWHAPDPVAAPEDADALLREAAAAGFVLLRNEGGLLPLADRHQTIAVIGPNAAAPCLQGGTFAKIAVRPDAFTPLAAIRARFVDRTILYAPGVDPSPRLPPMPVRPARDLGDGRERGMTVDYIAGHDPDAAPFLSETRDTNSLAWFQGMNPQARFDAPGIVRASGWFTPERSGPHEFVLGGTGPVTLTVGGRTIVDCRRDVAPADIMGTLKAGEGETGSVTLDAGVPVAVTAELRFAPARAHGLWYGVRGAAAPGAMLADAVAAAARADVVLLFLGETSDSGVESRDRTTTMLDAPQRALAAAVLAANPNVAVIVNVGHAFDPFVADGAPALLSAWYPGEQYGPAIADVLAGDREPSGRLPVTLASDADYGVFSLAPEPDGTLPYRDAGRIGYRGMAAPPHPAFAFGAGLGYGKFTYDDLGIERDGDGLVANVAIRNLSMGAASETVQLYLLDPAPRLLGFVKIAVAASGRAEARIAIDGATLARTRAGRAAMLDLAVGRSCVDLRLTGRFADDG